MLDMTIPGSRFGDAEDIVCDLLDSYLAAIEGAEILSATQFPDGFEDDLGEDQPFVLVTRISGVADYSGGAISDPAQVNIAVVSNTRRDSWKIMSYLRDRLFEDRSGVDQSGFHISKITELLGPVDDPFSDPRRRMVNMNFQFDIRRHRW